MGNMRLKPVNRSLRLALTLVISAAALTSARVALADTGAAVMNQPAGSGQAALPSSAPAEAPALTQHILDLIKSHQVVELRTIYNGPFAAAMFFNPASLNYTVVLLKHHAFWWVGETADGHKAEQLYTKLATQTIRLAEPDLAKIQLDARIAVARRSLDAQQKREAELAQQISAQQKIVEAGTAAQSQLLAEAHALDEQREALEQRLAETNTAIAGLQSKSQAGPTLSLSDSQAPLVQPQKNQGTPPMKSRIQIRATAHP